MRIESKDIKLIAISEIKENPKNRNTHPKEQIERLTEIIRHQGFRQPVVVSNRTGLMVAGHGRLLAAKELRLSEVPVMYQDFESEEQEYAFGVSDNAIAAWAELDLSGINFDVPELGPDFDLDMLGIKDFVLEPAEKFEAQSDEDSVPEHVEPRAKLGDIYQLGRHRLMCGDSTSIDAVEKLMAGEKADMVFTDPPYGINLDTDFSKMSDGGYTYKKVENDDKPFDATAILGFFPETKEIFLWGAENYLGTLANGGSWIVWDKSTDDADGCFFANPVELCWSKHRHKYAVYRKYWRMMAAKEAGEKRMHPTQKPIAMAEWFIETYGKSIVTIVDLFGGSGSTLIACEKTNRKCFMMELDPHYIDVIVARWEKYSGQKAELLNPQGEVA
jgi:DNA modification methylase